MEAFLKNPDPVMERALIEAAVPPGLGFDPQKSRLILDPMIASDSGLKLKSGEDGDSSKETMMWQAVSQTAKRMAETGPPSSAIDWLGTLPFASQDDYSKAMAGVLTVWNLKSSSDAAGWLQNSTLNPSLKSDLAKVVGSKP